MTSSPDGEGGVSQRMTNDDEGEEGIHSKSDSVCGICLQNYVERCINYADKISRQKCELIKITRISCIGGIFVETTVCFNVLLRIHCND